MAAPSGAAHLFSPAGTTAGWLGSIVWATSMTSCSESTMVGLDSATRTSPSSLASRAEISAVSHVRRVME
ncbi:hypothetical protein PJ267_04890 [Arthrobacter sp. OVS8]|nr:hypothetical protein PJ267_04890 [Arthrobacter sp. OVS8]